MLPLRCHCHCCQLLPAHHGGVCRPLPCLQTHVVAHKQHDLERSSIGIVSNIDKLVAANCKIYMLQSTGEHNALLPALCAQRAMTPACLRTFHSIICACG